MGNMLDIPDFPGTGSDYLTTHFDQALFRQIQIVGT